MPSIGGKSQFSWRSGVIFLTGMTLASLALLSMLDASYSFNPGTSSIKTSPSIESNQAPYPTSSSPIDVNWYPPARTKINSLESVINGTGIYGFIFNSSTTPHEVPYNTYNWCNMPHIRAQAYKVPCSDYELQYVEVIHRHHKRTPYASNTFPIEQHSWSCSDAHLYYYASSSPNNTAAQINWQITPPTLPLFAPSTIGFPNSTCQFPQITSEGLRDSHQHGQDLRSVYIDLLRFLPSTYNPNLVTFRVTNNVITSQVASQVIQALYPSSLTNTSIPVTVHPYTLDTLEPTYPCPAAQSLSSSYSIGSNNTAWLTHLHHPSTTSLFADLDGISGVNVSDPTWHDWVDHYFDNLSAKLCHEKPLGCNIANPDRCISRDMADDVFRRGMYEYSYIYRDDPRSLRAARGTFGGWIAEVAANIRTAIARGGHSLLHSKSQLNVPVDSTNTDPNTATNLHKMKHGKSIKYRHNVAHDGSISRLLSLLQVDVMVWPGMGSEVIFELWRRRSTDRWYVRILWMGEVLRSSSPMLMGDEGEENGMIGVERFLGYVDGLVGRNGARLEGLCYGEYEGE